VGENNLHREGESVNRIMVGLPRRWRF